MKQKYKETRHSKHDDFFKQCPACKKVWEDREELLADSEAHIIGYQAHFADLTLGLFLFNHSCNGTFAIPAEEFLDMYKGPAFEKKFLDTEQCPGYCRHQKSLEPCPLQCECAYIREIIQILKKHPVASHEVPRNKE